MGRPVQQTFRIDSSTYPLSYSYTDSGCGCAKADLRSMNYPDGLQINYTRDSISRIQAISSPSISTYIVQNVAYDLPSGGISTLTFGWGQEYYSLDPYGRLLTLHLQGAWPNGVIWTYGYTAAGRITQISEAMIKPQDGLYHSASFNYAYDNRGRVTSASRQSDDSSTDWNLSFSYDRYGNLLTKQPAGAASTVYTPDAATNRLTSYRIGSGSTRNLTYDSAGYVTSDSTNGFSYNGMGLLKQVNAGQTGNYRYDALGRRVQRTWSYAGTYGTKSGTMTYVYGPDGQIVAEYKNETTPENGNEVTTTDNVAMNGRILARRITGNNRFGSINRVEGLYRNHLNEVAMIDAWSGSYGTGFTTPLNTYAQPFSSGGSDQFPGQKEDPESKLKDFGARHFSATLARWTSADAILGHTYDPLSLNKYTYVRNDPVNLVDPDGRDPFVVSVTVWGRYWINNPGLGGGSDPSAMEILNDSLPEPDGSGGGPDPIQARMDFLKGVLGDNNKNVLDRVVGACAKFIDAMVKQLQPSYAYPNAHDWVSWHLGKTVEWNYFGADKYSDVGLGSNGWAYAKTVGNTIYLGDMFFSDTTHDDVLTVIHELFHLEAVSPTGDNLSHEELIGLAANAGYKATSWNQLMHDECGKK